MIKICSKKYPNKYKFPLLAATLTAFILFTSELMENELSPLDFRIYRYLSRLITGNLTDAVKLISDMGAAWVLAAEAVFLFLWLWKKRKYRFYGIMAVANLLAVSLLNAIFKTIFHRKRPDILRLVQAGGYSFPSGHSMVSAAFYGYLIYLCVRFVKRPWKQLLSSALLTLIFLIGVSRIYLGVHYASDVIGGFLAGCSWLILFVTWIQAYESIRGRKGH